ncbi:Mrp/NBP35 family ATP-binding protein [Carboxylicivirga sp. A043]|uniref:Mrp/NBP35 family ATP-binding protein n=1 Tax=Carboxylicivirga litoralis TaxID=2816963 RepID=UPI0021CB223B|nr:Mrp/NBP35 family ATP-binding protein [Carboxylicivirga sp. A043]MCU4156807.1 Mrp/NBP35 family ATP-binding protein [Carboxylicivirga sp. A043]
MSEYSMVKPIQEEKLLKDVKNVILVASGKGGVGKSTVAANLAISLSREGLKTGLLDADLYGPSTPIQFGIDEMKPSLTQHNGKNYIEPIEKYGVKLMSIGLLTNKEDAMIWRGPMASKTLKQIINDTLWGELDVLVIDMPPGTGDICITLAQDIKQAQALVVITPQQLAVADGRKALTMFNHPTIAMPVVGIVENMAWFTPAAHPDERYTIFGKGGGQQLANEFAVPLIAQIPLVMDIEEMSDTGKSIYHSNDKTLHQAFEKLAVDVIKQLRHV